MAYIQKNNPFTVTACGRRRAGGIGSGFKKTRKVCLPKAKIESMSESEKKSIISAKQRAADQGKTRRSSSSNTTGTSSKSLTDWVKQDWRQVGDPSKKCGEA